MKRIIFALALGASLLVGAGCQKLNDLESKVEKNTSDIETLKTQIAALQDIVNKGYVITETKEITGGYEFTLSNGKKITVTNGKDGKDGVDGKDGKDGKDGDSFFGSVTVDKEAGIVKIVLKDGTAFNVPLAVEKSIVEQITKVMYFPEYSDLKLTFNYFDDKDYEKIKLNFAVLPALAMEKLAANMDKAVIMVGAFGLKTRATSSVGLESTITYDSKEMAFTALVDPKNYLAEYGLDTEFGLSVAIADADFKCQIFSDIIPVHNNCSALVYEGERYHTATLFDGSVWMAENLRYLPDGVTPSTDPTDFDNGIWFPVDMNTKALTADEQTIKSQGYLYTADFAFGQTITADNYDTFEGCQGICPEGWHIPTGAEIFKITGRLPGWPGSKTATTPGDKSSESPYNNSTETTLGNCMMELLNQDGFNAANTGGITCVATTDNRSATNAMGYYLGSTAYKYNAAAAKVAVAYAQYNVMMPVKAGTCNGAQSSNRSGFAVRCVKD